MRIMTVADEEVPRIWDYYQPGMFNGIDLILSAGDLNPHYLSFIETFSNVPLLYVHGNHDTNYKYDKPEGCICIDDDIYIHDGVRILGLGGSMQYRPGAPHQFTEWDMRYRIFKLSLKLMRYGGFDILLTHAPLAGFHDDPTDRCHRGFDAFRILLEHYCPDYFIHGHIHMNYGGNVPRVSRYGQTIVINAYQTYTFEYNGGKKKKKESAEEPK